MSNNQITLKMIDGKERTINLEEKLNIIYGVNNGGKTTLLKTILSERLKPFVEESVSYFNPHSTSEDELLPLYAFFDEQRYCRVASLDAPDYEKSSRLNGYDYYYNPTENIKNVMPWLVNRTSVALQRHYRFNDQNPVVENIVIRDAIMKVLPSCTDFYFCYDRCEIIVTLYSKEIPFSELGSSYKQIVYLTLDLVYRCFKLNPHLGENACSETKGIVLIDDIMMNMTELTCINFIIGLCVFFKNINFVITTHSDNIAKLSLLKK